MPCCSVEIMSLLPRQLLVCVAVCTCLGALRVQLQQGFYQQAVPEQPLMSLHSAAPPACSTGRDREVGVSCLVGCQVFAWLILDSSRRPW